MGLSSVLGHQVVVEDTVSYHYIMEFGGKDADKL